MVEVVIAIVDAAAEDVAFFAAEEVEEGDDYAELPVVDAGARDVEAVDVDCQDTHEVAEHGDGEAGAGEGAQADQADDVREQRAELAHAVVPVVNDPEEQVAEEGGEVVVEFQAGGPAHEPGDHALEAGDGVGVDEAVHLGGDEGGVFDDVAAQGDADDDVVGDEPEAVEEADVFRVGGGDALPVAAAAVEGEVLGGPVAELLEADVDLLRRGGDIFEGC